ncbi:acyltransferase [Morganella morganii]|uniref:acyltransferase n=1 Tax=Morganella morganii TaxID=582 RepID=UPI001C461A2E|nr:acyltransferase [Morganella morganii]QXO65366.1 acyltransferase [Morganella morganii]
MSLFYKVSWYLRAIFLKFFFKKIGNFSIIGKPIFLHNPKKIKIGNKVRIFPGSRFECHNSGEIVILDNVSIGQNFHVISANEPLYIHPGVVISANVCITNVDHEYKDINLSISEQKIIFKKTEIGKNCFIGYGAMIQAGTILGNHCIVGANATVRGIFPDYSIIVGTPGRILKKIKE